MYSCIGEYSRNSEIDDDRLDNYVKKKICFRIVNKNSK